MTQLHEQTLEEKLEALGLMPVWEKAKKYARSHQIIADACMIQDDLKETWVIPQSLDKTFNILGDVESDIYTAVECQLVTILDALEIPRKHPLWTMIYDLMETKLYEEAKRL